MTAMPPQVEVIWIDIDAATGTLPHWHALLSPDERERAERFHFDRDRDRFIARRGILRTLLARRLGETPSALRFTCNPYGKPGLAGGGCAFNLSHSRGYALYAFGDIDVGCDIEFHDPRFLADKIPERLFSAAEVRELRAYPDERQTAAFFDAWTRKEAYIKARGLGLALSLDSFDVSLAPSEHPSLYRGCTGWSARCVAPASQCSAAVIAQSENWQMVAGLLDATTLIETISAAP